MTKEGIENAIGRIKQSQVRTAEFSGHICNFSPLGEVNSVLRYVVSALQEGASVDDFSPLIDPAREQRLSAIISRNCDEAKAIAQREILPSYL